jgi:polyhydroxybutyrate depolymerase
MQSPSAIAITLCFALAAACGDDGNSDGGTITDAGNGEVVIPDQTSFGGVRPTELRVPSSYDHTGALPLLLVLHGYTSTGTVQLSYTGLDDLVESQQIFVMAPDGLVDDAGNQYWNATKACCDFNSSGVDDSTYLRGLIDEVSSVYKIDPMRIYLWGHSNGGFMAHRMACDHADVIAGITSLAGAMHLTSEECDPSEAVNILQVHGDLDATILYDGGSLCTFPQCTYPSADTTLDHWAGLNGCSGSRTTTAERLDLDTLLVGDDTSVARQDGCPSGGTVELWAIEEGGHVPALGGDYDDITWAWFSENPKP